MTIREFVRTVWAGKYYVLAAVLVVVAAALVYLDRQETVYEATATVQIIAAESVPGADQATSTVTVDTDPSFVHAAPVAQAAAVTLGTGETPRALASTVHGFFNGDLQTMEVTAQGSEPQIAIDRANAFAQAYVAYLPTVLQGQIADLEERQTKLREQLATIQAEIAVLPDDPLAGAERDTVIQQYTAISAQRSTFESIVSPGQIVTPATSAKPLGLGAPVVLAIAVLLALVAGVGLAFARRGLDFRVQSSTEAAALAETPVLAELYGVRAAERDHRRLGVLPVSSRTASPYTESIRELRTAVQVSIGNVGHSVVAVTAADPHAPRAFIAANLAASFALSGRRTIVVPGDLRRPQIADLLAPPEDWDGPPNALRPTRVPNLSVMPVHDEEMDPADFLATAAVRQLVQDLGDDAVVVVIDSPPVLAAADATILGGYAHGVVLVASAGQTDRVVLKEAADRLRINNVPLVGLAITGLKGDRRMIYASTYGADGDGRDLDEVERADEVLAEEVLADDEVAVGAVGPEASVGTEAAVGPEDGGAPLDGAHSRTAADPDSAPVADPDSAPVADASTEAVAGGATDGTTASGPADRPGEPAEPAEHDGVPVPLGSVSPGSRAGAGSPPDARPRGHVAAHAIPVGRVVRPAQESGPTTPGASAGPDHGSATARSGRGDSHDRRAAKVTQNATVAAASGATRPTVRRARAEDPADARGPLPTGNPSAAATNAGEPRRKHRAKRLAPEWAKVPTTPEAPAAGDEDDRPEPRRRPFRW